MKKIKKILLALAPFTAIAIATPILLTACSDTTTNTTTPYGDNGTGQKPDGEGNGGGNNSGEGSKPITPSFDADNTNSDKYQLEGNSKAQEILNKYKTAKGKAVAEKVLADELANFPKKDSGTLAKDVLNMWSNNNWFTITKTAKDEKVKEPFISNLIINKAEVIEEGGKNKATFNAEYKNAFVDSTGKLYEATQVLKADKVEVDASTKIEISKEIPGNSYKINGKDQPLTSTSLLETSPSNPQTNLENNLKQNLISLDAKQIFQTFITNHNISHAEEEKPAPNINDGLWIDSIKKLDNGKVVLNTDKTQINVFLDKFSNTDDWYGLKKTFNESAIRNIVYSTDSTKKVNNLNDTFKALVNGKDAFTEITVSPSVDKSKKVISFTITLKKQDQTTKTLKLNVKYVA